MARKYHPTIKFKTSDWLNKDVFFAMLFLTVCSVFSACAAIYTTNSGREIDLDDVKIENTKVPPEYADSEWDGDIFLVCNQPDDEEFLKCLRIFYEEN